MKQRRVLHLLASNRYSGAENVACTIIKNNTDISFYCSPTGPIQDTLKEQDVMFIPWDKKISSLKNIVKQYQIDLIHAHDFKCSFAASFLSKKVEVISHLHCNPDFLKSWNPYSFMYRFVSKRFKHVIVVSHEILEGTVFNSYIEHKVTVLPNVVDAKKVGERSQKFETSSYDLTFLGRLIPLKQPLFFIDLVKEAARKYPNLRACMIGDGELYEVCEQKIKQEGLEQVIDLVGFQENPFPYLKHAKANILPSTTEGLPMSVIECMILNVPVINSGVGGLTKMFEKYPEYLCKTLDDYLKAIDMVFEKSPQMKQMECQFLIEPYIDMKHYIQTIQQIYQGK